MLLFYAMYVVYVTCSDRPLNGRRVPSLSYPGTERSSEHHRNEHEFRCAGGTADLGDRDGGQVDPSRRRSPLQSDRLRPDSPHISSEMHPLDASIYMYMVCRVICGHGIGAGTFCALEVICVIDVRTYCSQEIEKKKYMCI